MGYIECPFKRTEKIIIVMKLKLTKEQVLGILRHTFTFVGGFLLMKGIVDEAAWELVSGSALTLVGSVWSIIKNS
jgi:hypothetical protein